MKYFIVSTIRRIIAASVPANTHCALFLECVADDETVPCLSHCLMAKIQIRNASDVRTTALVAYVHQNFETCIWSRPTSIMPVLYIDCMTLEKGFRRALNKLTAIRFAGKNSNVTTAIVFIARLSLSVADAMRLES